MSPQSINRTQMLRAALCAAFIGVATGTPASAQAEDSALPFDAVPADAGAAFGGMSISPTRILMKAGASGGQVTLYNSSEESVSYRVDLVDLAIDETGAYRDLAEGEDAPWSASPFIRHAPRQVTLKPGERQTVKFIATAPRDLPANELRSHIRFSSIPVVAPVTEAKPADDSDREPNSVSISVGLDYRISIPLILSVGELEEGARIQSARLVAAEAGGRQAEVVLARTGGRTTYGAVRILAADGTELGAVRNIAVLPPNETRKVTVTLSDSSKPPAEAVFDKMLDSHKTGDRLSQLPLK